MFIKTVSSMAALVSHTRVSFSLLAASTVKKTIGCRCVKVAHVLSKTGAYL